jgi:putative acetyltransferase
MNIHHIRTLKPSDEDAVDALVDAAFDTMEEVHLIHALRASGEMMQEHVMEQDGELIGYAALSTMLEPAGWLCLAPVAIAPAFQGKGYGVKIVGKIAALANEIGPEIVVLGKPSFYEASGFSNARAANLVSPYPVEYMSLAGPGDDVPAVELVYPKAFDALS